MSPDKVFLPGLLLLWVVGVYLEWTGKLSKWRMIAYRTPDTIPEEPKPKSRFIINHKCNKPGIVSRWWNNVGLGDMWICECGKRYTFRVNTSYNYNANWYLEKNE